MLALGNPAKPVRPLKEKDFALIRRTLENYQGLKKVYEASLPRKPVMPH
jgi:carbonic anhydrase/acetyltransferase-like protein (isoleucine patch superfamily)